MGGRQKVRFQRSLISDFFFSSRRRHTRLTCDWSSDVCSSDLNWLYAALHRAGFANQPTSVRRDDGLELRDAFVSAAARCAPPANRPTPFEIATCRRWLVGEDRKSVV